MSSRPRGRDRESRSPEAIPGIEAIDEYLLALDDTEHLDRGQLAVLERAFVLHAKCFAERRGVSFAAWRDVGVPVNVLACAGIFETVGP